MAPQTLRRAGPRPLQAARKPDSVLDDHSSRRRVAAPLQQPTRKFRLIRSSHPALAKLGRGTRTPLNSPPGRIGPIRRCPLESTGAVPAYLVLLRVGFTVRRSLLAVRCALAAPFHPYRSSCEIRRYIFCCTGRLCALKRKSRTLSGTLPCGVRTFLPLPARRPGSTGRGRRRSSSRLHVKCIAGGGVRARFSYARVRSDAGGRSSSQRCRYTQTMAASARPMASQLNMDRAW